jgi:2-polyprenyl-3-methyl-5-hydroxy-6-metoxy-1,4-benzoquinol methylase
MNEVRYAQWPQALVWTSRDSLWASNDGHLERYDGESAHFVKAIFALCQTPKTVQSIVAHLHQLSGETPEAALLEKTLHRLVHLNVLRIVAENDKAVESEKPLLGYRLVLCVTGAVAAVNAPALVLWLQSFGAEVRVALTSAATRFVRPLPFEALTHHRAYDSLWNGPPENPAPHIDLAEWASAALIYPCSGNTISKLAQADCAEVVTAFLTAFSGPKFIFPSMNEFMWNAPLLQRQVELLVENGFTVLEPVFGLKVATPIALRTKTPGPALAPKTAAQVIVKWLSTIPKSTVDWPAQYARKKIEEQDFYTENADEDFTQTLSSLSKSSLLDAGCGPGTVSLAAAQLGFDVTALDCAGQAFDSWKKRASELNVRIVAVDFFEHAPEVPYSVVIDRGFLHGLLPTAQKLWTQKMASLLQQGGVLLVKTHAEARNRQWNTHAFSMASLLSLTRDEFECLSLKNTTFPCRIPESPSALFGVFRRK